MREQRYKLSQARLKEVLHYDPVTGVFSCIDGSRGSVGCISHGYQKIMIDNVRFAAHRLAWLYVYGEMPWCIDHINQVRNDNRIENLRSSSMTQNNANTGLDPRNRLGIKGVQICRQKFSARIRYQRKLHYLGTFETSDEAAHAYNKAAVKFFGEFACLNPIGTDKRTTAADNQKGGQQ